MKKVIIGLVVVLIILVGLIFVLNYLDNQEQQAAEINQTPQAFEPVQYAANVIQEGSGEEAVKVGDMVSVNYAGMLEDGTEFDSSYKRNEPIIFTVGANELISGFEQGVVGMKVGEIRQLAIPPELAYGSDGIPGVVPSNANLFFEIELMSINATSAKEIPADLGIETLKAGSGEQEVVEGDSVTVNYTGTLEDGTKFDSSLDRGIPFTFTVGTGEVIKGWDLGIVGMKVGEKRQLTIPANLAYGADGFGDIPANATLIFRVDLISINE
jgi:FKBP-type peptidyl-prolyl cis-trans isomerase